MEEPPLSSTNILSTSVKVEEEEDSTGVLGQGIETGIIIGVVEYSSEVVVVTVLLPVLLFLSEQVPCSVPWGPSPPWDPFTVLV